MSLSKLNSPPLVLGAGAVIAAGTTYIAGTDYIPVLSVHTMQILNAVSFAINALAVSVPGRIDSIQASKMQHGDTNPEHEHLTGGDSKNERLTTGESKTEEIRKAHMERSMFVPAPWAFSIWGPIYLGEAAFCVAQFFDPWLKPLLGHVTIPFVTANLFQSLWCASFRPSYAKGWYKYISVAMLGGTVAALYNIPPNLSLYLLPMTVHLAWNTAATLVNWNGSVAQDEKTTESDSFAVAHASSIFATAMGIGVTVVRLAPVYGLTIAWALTAIANGKPLKEETAETGSTGNARKTGAQIQKTICWTGALMCLAASAFITTIPKYRG